MGELISVLWEGRPDTGSVRSQLRSLITDLRTTLRQLEEKSIIIKRRDLIAIDPTVGALHRLDEREPEPKEKQ